MQVLVNKFQALLHNLQRVFKQYLEFNKFQSKSSSHKRKSCLPFKSRAYTQQYNNTNNTWIIILSRYFSIFLFGFAFLSILSVFLFQFDFGATRLLLRRKPSYFFFLCFPGLSGLLYFFS